VTDLATRPHGRLVRVRDALTPREWARAGAMAATIIGLNVLGWGMLAAVVGGHYHITRTEIFGFGTGILAYTLGMRHAFDADHIAAIDNTTRKLAGEGKRPLSTGFFFSLGHSSIVFVLALLLNFGIRALDDQVRNGSSGLHTMTGIIGTGVSGTFLYLIAALNVVVLAITGLSVFVAFFIGTVEILGLIEQEYQLGGGFWTFMGNFDINKAGFVVVGVLVLTWAVALSIWHFGKIEQKWDTAKAAAPD